VLQQQRVPVGFRRNVYRALAQAYTTLGRADEAHTALERSGYPSLDPTLPLFTADSWVTAQEGFRFSPRRFVEVAPRSMSPKGTTLRTSPLCSPTTALSRLMPAPPRPTPAPSSPSSAVSPPCPSRT